MTYCNITYIPLPHTQSDITKYLGNRDFLYRYCVGGFEHGVIVITDPDTNAIRETYGIAALFTNTEENTGPIEFKREDVTLDPQTLEELMASDNAVTASADLDRNGNVYLETPRFSFSASRRLPIWSPRQTLAIYLMNNTSAFSGLKHAHAQALERTLELYAPTQEF
jgi:hypothetical protein